MNLRGGAQTRSLDGCAATANRIETERAAVTGLGSLAENLRHVEDGAQALVFGAAVRLAPPLRRVRRTFRSRRFRRWLLLARRARPAPSTSCGLLASVLLRRVSQGLDDLVEDEAQGATHAKHGDATRARPVVDRPPADAEGASHIVDGAELDGARRLAAPRRIVRGRLSRWIARIHGDGARATVMPASRHAAAGDGSQGHEIQLRGTPRALSEGRMATGLDLSRSTRNRRIRSLCGPDRPRCDPFAVPLRSLPRDPPRDTMIGPRAAR